MKTIVLYFGGFVLAWGVLVLFVIGFTHLTGLAVPVNQLAAEKEQPVAP